MPTIMIVTANAASAASADELTEQDYRDIYAELRTKASLRRFAETIASGYSFAWWSKYERSQVTLTQQARSELRRAVGLAELPLPIGAALADVDPDATVYQVGEGAAERVVLVSESGAITFRLNSHLQILDSAPEGHVTGLHGAPRPRARGSIVIDRATWDRLNAARQAAGLSWDAFVSRLVPGDAGQHGT